MLVRFARLLSPLLAVCAVSYSASRAPAGAATNPPLRLTFLALDRGEATLVQAPGGTNALIGAGAPGEADTIVAALKRHGVTQIDPLVLLTWNERHLGGALELLQRYKPRQVIRNPIYLETPLARRFYLAAQKLDNQHKLFFNSPTPGQSFTAFYSPPCQMTFAGPTGPMLARYQKTGCSLTMGYDYDRFTALLLGDMDRTQQQVLWHGLDEKPQAQVLVLGRHGDEQSLLPSLLKPLKTRIAIIPVPRKGPRPAPATLQALRNARIRIYRTDQDGEITVTTDGANVSVKRG